MSSLPAAKTLGLNASALRKQKGWSQDAFAKHLGWPLCTVVELEAGTFDATLDHIDQLAACLGTAPHALLTQVDAQFVQNEARRIG